MNIGEASAASGVSAKMIRYYEAVGLIGAAQRSASGYRRYAQGDVQTLRFLHRARTLGFSAAQMRTLLSLWRDQGRASGDVKRLALAHVAELEAKARALSEMSAALRSLAEQCDGDQRPECPIIGELAAEASVLQPLGDPVGELPQQRAFGRDQILRGGSGRRRRQA